MVNLRNTLNFNKYYTLILFCLVLTTGCNKDEKTENEENFDSDPVWTQISEYPEAGIRDPISFSLNGKGYVGLGFRSHDIYNSNTIKSFYCYDPVTNKWSQKTFPPVPDRKYTPNYTSLVIGDKAYVWYSQNLTLYVYDPKTDIWTSHNINVPLENREVSTAFTINGKGYFLTSYSGTVWEFNPASMSFSRKKDFPSGGTSYGWFEAFEVGGKGYVLYGTTTKVQIWQYNPVSDSWALNAEIYKSFEHVAFLFKFDSRVYVGAGTSLYVSGLTDSATVLRHDLSRVIWCFDPANNTVGHSLDFDGTIRTGSGYFTINNKGYVIAGTTVNDEDKIEYLRDCWVYGR